MAEDPPALSGGARGPGGGEPGEAAASAPEILGLGMSMVDLLQIVEEFPAATGVTESSAGVLGGGGPVPTALCAAARLGASAAVLDRVGDDPWGRWIREDYERFGVDAGFLRHEAGRRSSFATVLVRRRDGERHVVFRPGDCTPLSAAELPAAALENCRVLHLNGRHWPACVEAARRVRAAGGLVSFDGGADRYDPKFLELLPHVDLLLTARDFAERLAGSTRREDLLAALGRWGAAAVGFTDGERGSWIAPAEGEAFHQPAFPVERPEDTTGCGDAWHGAFLHALVRGGSWKECARAASAAGACNAAALGGRGNLPTPEMLAETLRNGQVVQPERNCQNY